MASDTDTTEGELSVPIDYVPGTRGHGVLVVGSDSDGGEALAVWRLSPTGRAGGAWVLRFDEIERDLGRLDRVMSMMRGRCLIDWELEAAATVLNRISDLLPIELVSALRSNILMVPDLLTEIGEHRERYAEAAEQHRAAAKSKIAPLAWPTELPDRQRLTERFAAQPAAASPVGAAALVLTSVVARTAQLWQDTEQTRYRRTYLRSLGEPQPLPPRWLAQLRKAAGSTAVAPA